ncbi:uncharacterized protein LOC107739874 isoform X2 [Sinocyclocheilus rhinocerous]|uniref:uncharacterized protein LOC107739874 isoform X2 n=1 Tax=Sinocyclocheilus rhinocerous TaxID=307959 RepID=UPI0007B9F68F|nr:PREDICTED: uncharacterized protein LOC107739874 isoform X2 [Sinocyclocheilus rhinocerous]
MADQQPSAHSSSQPPLSLMCQIIFWRPSWIYNKKNHAALSQEVGPVLKRECGGGRGQPKFFVSEEMLSRLIEMSLPVSCIANILGVSHSTIFRRMRDLGLSVKTTYSTISDNELDNAISAIKRRLPNAGYRMIKGCLQADGHRVQWNRIKESMHRVDAPGILERMTQLGCIVRRSYFVKSPLSLVHIDTNHKLIRYNIIIFGGIDGFSRKIMYLEPATNNRSSTALSFFLQSVQNHGWPSKVRGDEGVENVAIAETMFRVKGTGRGSYIAGKSIHNQRIERLWRDVWLSVTQLYYEILHSLEEDGLLDLSDSLHLFCAHYVFLPRLKHDLHTFSEGWDNHPLQSENVLTPNQLWITHLVTMKRILRFVFFLIFYAFSHTVKLCFCMMQEVICFHLRIWNCLEQTGRRLIV